MVKKGQSKDIIISTNKSRLNLKLIYIFLKKESYWAKNTSLAQVETSIKNSLSIGIYRDKKQVGFVRVITDYSTFAYLSDFFVLKRYRGRGYAKMLLEYIIKHPKLQNLRMMLLITKDGHGLYKKFGFKKPQNSNLIMVRI